MNKIVLHRDGKLQRVQAQIVLVTDWHFASLSFDKGTRGMQARECQTCAKRPPLIQGKGSANRSPVSHYW
jgi:hypothetical protein